MLPKTTHVAIAGCGLVLRSRHLVTQRLVARRRGRDRQRCRAGRVVPVGRGVRRNGGPIRDWPAAGGVAGAEHRLVRVVPRAARLEGRLGFIVSLAYPVSDVVILTVAAVVMIRAQTQQRPALQPVLITAVHQGRLSLRSRFGRGYEAVPPAAWER